MKPFHQIQLYGLDKYFNEIKKFYDYRKMPKTILLSGKKGIGKSTLAYHIINYILSQFEDNPYNINNFTINKNNKSFILLNNKTHPNFYLIDLIDEKKNKKLINTHLKGYKFTPLKKGLKKTIKYYEDSISSSK